MWLVRASCPQPGRDWMWSGGRGWGRWSWWRGPAWAPWPDSPWRAQSRHQPRDHLSQDHWHQPLFIKHPATAGEKIITMLSISLTTKITLWIHIILLILSPLMLSQEHVQGCGCIKIFNPIWCCQDWHWWSGTSGDSGSGHGRPHAWLWRGVTVTHEPE